MMETGTQVIQLKLAAKQALRGNYGVAIAAGIIYGLIYLVINLVAPAGGTSAISYILMQGVSIVISLLAGVFMSGFAYLNLRMVYGEKPVIADLFHGFKEEPNKAIQIQVIFVVYSLLFSIPAYMYELGAGEDINYAVWLALSVLAPVLSFVATLPFSQAFHLLQDFPERSAHELLRASARLMQGNKMRLVRLALSFLPFFLLSSFLMFIPLFWMMADYRAARAVFYKDLVGREHGIS